MWSGCLRSGRVRVRSLFPFPPPFFCSSRNINRLFFIARASALHDPSSTCRTSLRDQAYNVLLAIRVRNALAADGQEPDDNEVISSVFRRDLLLA